MASLFQGPTSTSPEQTAIAPHPITQNSRKAEIQLPVLRAQKLSC